jgi:hypothetical protein
LPSGRRRHRHVLDSQHVGAPIPLVDDSLQVPSTAAMPGTAQLAFPVGQFIIDGSTLRNGLKYDIESMDLNEYKGQATADHVDMISYVIGEALGLAKRKDAVTISGIRFAVKENALARLAYDLLVGGFPLDLSIETYGPWPDQSDDTRTADDIDFDSPLMRLAAGGTAPRTDE